MPFTVTMPKLSPTMEVGTIAQWHIKEGEEVEPGDLLLEISTDKATVEHNALDGGFLRKILVKEGEEVPVNEPIAIFTESKDESIKDFELPKAIKEEAPEKVEVEEKEEKPAARKEVVGMQQPAFVPEQPLEGYEFQVPIEEAQKRIKASPLARKIAEEKGLDLSTVKGSGPGGRIMQADLEKAQKKGPVVFGKREIPKHPPGAYEEEPLSQIRKVISQRLQQAKTFVPHFYVSQTVNAMPLYHLRQQLREMDVKVSVNDCVIRACALALREHPNINSGFNTENQSIIRFKTIDISVAVDLPEGLITPIIRYADYKNLGELSVEMRALIKKARAGKLAMEEFKGGSFTISNMGMFGVTNFQAIINPPQAAILAVSGINNVPVIKDGQVVPGKVMNISVSVDHRVIDGVQAAEFIKTVQKYLENPATLLI